MLLSGYTACSESWSTRAVRQFRECIPEETIMSTPPKKALRSQAWFGKADKDGFIHRSWMKNQGLPHHLFDVH